MPAGTVPPGRAVTLEDIFLLEDGSRAVSNAQLVAAASAIVQGSEGELSTLSW